MPTHPAIHRPSDLARLILASGDLLPRNRARDQQADLAGMELKRRMLDRLVGLDPEPEGLATALEQIVFEMDTPSGPARAVAGAILEDWEAASTEPALVSWLLEQAVLEGDEGRERKRRRAHS